MFQPFICCFYSCVDHNLQLWMYSPKAWIIHFKTIQKYSNLQNNFTFFLFSIKNSIRQFQVSLSDWILEQKLQLILYGLPQTEHLSFAYSVYA